MALAPFPTEIWVSTFLTLLSTIQSGFLVTNPERPSRHSQQPPLKLRMCCKMKELLNLMHVCKTWRLVILDSEKICAELDFRFIGPVLLESLIKAIENHTPVFQEVNDLFLPRAGAHMLKQVLIYAPEVPYSSPNPLTEWMVNMRPIMARAERLEVKLSRQGGIGNPNPDPNLKLLPFLTALENSTILKHLVFERVLSISDEIPNLQMLHQGISLPSLRMAEFNCLADIPSLLCPSLVELTLRNYSITFNSLKDLARGSPLLRTLILNRVQRETRFQIPVTEIGSISLPSLETLTVRHKFAGGWRNRIDRVFTYDVSTPRLTHFSFWIDPRSPRELLPIRTLGALDLLTSFEVTITSACSSTALIPLAAWFTQASPLQLLTLISDDTNAFAWQSFHGASEDCDITPIIECLLDTSIGIRCPNLRNITCKGDRLRSRGLLWLTWF